MDGDELVESEGHHQAERKVLPSQFELNDDESEHDGDVVSHVLDLEAPISQDFSFALARRIHSEDESKNCDERDRPVFDEQP